MIENIRERIISNAPVVAAGLALTAVLSGCDGKGDGFSPTPDHMPTSELPRCYETPHKPDKAREPTEKEVITLRRGIDGHLSGEATPAAGVRETAMGATVKVRRGAAAGSGALVGKQTVVTAAHVAHGKLSGLQIIDGKGKTARVTGGCYMHDTGNGHLGNVTNAEALPIDVAVLHVDREIGSAVLKVASKPAPRGGHIFFTNYQSKRTPPTPAAWYEGIHTTSAAEPLRHLAVTGIEPWRYKEGDETYTIHPEASGGAVVEPRTGHIVGLSTGNSTNEGGRTVWINEDALLQRHGLRFRCAQPNDRDAACSLGSQSGIVPVEARIVHPRFIHQALSSVEALPPPTTDTASRTPSAQGAIYLNNAKLSGSAPNQRHSAGSQPHRYPPGRQPGRRLPRQRARA